MLESGQRIDERYEVEALIGHGGLSEVYRVRHVELGSVHALKLLLFRKKSLAQRLLLEGRIQAQLRHPNVVAVTDVVRHEGQFGLLMEYVDNVGLDVLIEQRGSLGLEESLEMIAPILAGVHAAHQAGVLHRDLKPANVLLARTRSGGIIPKVSDFGIAKVVDDSLDGATREGVAMGTPGYMAPEQVLDARSVDVRTDIFALAAIFYELVAGQRAFADERGEVTVRSTLEGTVLPLHELVEGIPRHISDVIGRAMSRDREARFDTVAAFAAELLVERGDLLAMVVGSTPSHPISLDPSHPSPFTDSGETLGPTGQGPTILPVPTASTYASGALAPGGTAAAAPSTPTSTLSTSETRERRTPPAFWTAAGITAGLLAVGATLGLLVAGPGVAFRQAPVPVGDEPAISAGEPIGSVSVVHPEPRTAVDEEAPGGADAGTTEGPPSVDPTPGAAAGSATASPATTSPAAGATPAVATTTPSGSGTAAPGGAGMDAGGAVEGAGDAEPSGAADPSGTADAAVTDGAASPGTAEPVATAQPTPAAATPAATPPEPEPVPLAMPMDTFIASTWDGEVFRQPFVLRMLRERSGEVWAEGRIVIGANQRILPMVGRFDPVGGGLFLRESNGDLVIEGRVSGSTISGTYRRSGRDRKETLNLTRR